MARNRIGVRATPEAIFAVLDDAHAYPRWVVGARRLRHVDPEWPDVGSAFHHAIGVAGAEVQDWTRIVERDPPRRMVLDVRFRPTGTAQVALDVEPNHDGSTVTSTVIMEETATSGALARIPVLLSDPFFHARNALSLQRLRHEVERRDRPDP